MSYSKGSKGGGGCKGQAHGKSQASGKGQASGKSKASGYEPEDKRMDGDRTYQKYLDAANPIGALLYEVGGFFGRGGGPQSFIFARSLPGQLWALGFQKRSAGCRIDRFWHPQRSQMLGEGAKHIHD